MSAIIHIFGIGHTWLTIKMKMRRDKRKSERRQVQLLVTARRAWQINGCGDIELGMRIYRGPLAAVITRSSYPPVCNAGAISPPSRQILEDEESEAKAMIVATVMATTSTIINTKMP